MKNDWDWLMDINANVAGRANISHVKIMFQAFFWDVKHMINVDFFGAS